MQSKNISDDFFYEVQNVENPDFPFILHLDHFEGWQRFPAHWHECIELLLFVQGEAVINYDYIALTVKTGDLVVLNSGCIHDITCNGESCYYYVVTIDKAFTDSLGIQIETYSFSPIVNSAKISSLIKTIFNEEKHQDLFYFQAVKSLVTTIMIELCRNFSSSREDSELKDKPKQSEIVRKGICVIQRRFQQDINLDTICAEIGYSKYHFSRLFHKHTYRSVIDYLQRYRCEYARKLLRSGSCNVSESAHNCGISNLSYFTKLYRKYFGINPRDERPIDSVLADSSKQNSSIPEDENNFKGDDSND